MLLEKNPAERICVDDNGKWNGYETIKNIPYFKDIDWNVI